MTFDPATPFLRAKTQPPRLRTELIPRPALEARLASAVGATRLVLVCAPAGYGKTSLLSRVLTEGREGTVRGWLSLDAEDDLPRVLLALVEALDPFDLPWRIAPEALAQMAGREDGGAQRAAEVVLDALAGCEATAGVVVFEELHRVVHPPLFTWLERMVERLPPGWSFVLATRVDPPLPLARLRAQEELTEFRDEDLRFSKQEALALGQRIGSDNPALIEPLWQRTGGWPAGLRLALQTGDLAHASWATDRHAFDYLASEVLDQMPTELRIFLLRCSVLPELTAERCQAVSGDPEVAARLDEIERRRLFVAVLEGEERTLRLHDLFRDFLQMQLRRWRGEELPELLRRAANCERDPARRVDWWLQAGDLTAAQQSLAEAAPLLLLAGDDGRLLRLVETFPPEIRNSSPVLAFVRGMWAWPRFKWHTMIDAMGQATQGFSALGMEERAQQTRVFGALGAIAVGRIEQAQALEQEVLQGPSFPELEVMSALMAYWLEGLRGPAEGPARQLERMIDGLIRLPSPQLWLRCTPHSIFMGRPGVASAMERFARQAALLAGEEHPQLAATARTLMVWVLFWRGRVTEAQQAMRACLSDERWFGQTAQMRIARASFECILQLLRGSHEGCLQAGIALVAEVDRDEQRSKTGRGVYLFQAGRISAAVGDWDTVRLRLDDLAITPTDTEWPYMAVARPNLLARLALHEGDFERVVALLEPVLDSSAAHDLFSCDEMVRATLAAAQVGLGRMAQGWNSLAPAIAAARRSGEIMGLLMVGSELLETLARTDWGAVAPEADRIWLSTLLKQSRALRQAEPEARPLTDLEALSPREQEVLALIAAGSSNKQIARDLALSTHTVKRHVANILDKLDLATRGQAAAWWHSHHPA
ncbi:MAG: hypothetical protein COX57_01885 [Alphaproteobacteria bacterium CG_4_10_14_0_2_um_filter_63_37]|nr:MAG: hypothetical protein AUJ55_10880 [Proteobacteria bacterium CG1_02_64_396]PJA25758.1 MAG: hypothetical protein COX57_01885 [Alphaproteobacteria bacterium CG_4_10_14_0_2_um_filter_63_37]